jgi:hypothetical protein
VNAPVGPTLRRRCFDDSAAVARARFRSSIKTADIESRDQRQLSIAQLFNAGSDGVASLKRADSRRAAAGPQSKAGSQTEAPLRVAACSAVRRRNWAGPSL